MKFWSTLARALHPVKTTIFPSFCQLCGKSLEGWQEKIVCNQCLGDVVVHNGPLCPVCGRFYSSNIEGIPMCGSCLRELPPFSRHRSVGLYSGRLKEIIILFKYKGNEVLSQPLARLAFETLSQDGIFRGVDGIVPVPLHRKREKMRGFNQSELLARQLSRYCSLPVLSGFLYKIRNTPAQVSLEAQKRETNLKGAFKVRRADKLKGRSILLVDDVFTTGSTIGECSQALRTAGVREVRALTLARA